MQTLKDLIPALTNKLTTKPTETSKATNWRPTLDAYDPSLQKAADACAQFVCDMELEAEPYWLTLSGKNGCGKTMLMSQVLEQAKRINPGNPANNPIWPPDWQAAERKEYAPLRPYAMWLDEQRMATRMRQGEYDLAGSFRHDFFTAFDELGVARDPTNFVSDAVSTFCDSRVHKWAMFATNLSLSEIAQRIDARVSSRLKRDGSKLILISVGDYAFKR